MFTAARALGMSAWESPVVMTWGSLAVGVLGFATVLPLTLALLPAEEASAWFLFLALLTLLAACDFGFTPTFVRAVAYARAGGGASMPAVIGTMRAVYVRIALAGAALALLPGSAALWQPLAQVASAPHAWTAWALMALAAVVGLRGNMFAAFLQGSERIAAFRRREIAVGLAAVALSCAALLAGGGLLGLAAVQAAAALASYVANRALALRLAPPAAWRGRAAFDARVMSTVLPAAWRSGLGVVLAFAAVHGSGLAYAQLVPSAAAAPYLLALRIVNTLAQACSVPFYARLPTLARLYAEGGHAELVAVAGRGMLFSNWLLVAAIAFFGVAGAPLLALIGSRTPWVAAAVWWLLGAALLADRIGAMHLQLYSTSNRIVWHVANGVSGALMIAAMVPAYHWLGLSGLPLGMLVGSAAFYVPFSMRHSYRAFGLTPARIDLAGSAAPFAVCLCGLLAVLV